MKKEIVISGFGGQGGLAIGKNLAEAGMAEGLNVTWAPSYGPEMRGGTANCSVVLSDKPVGSPVFAHPTELIALNEPSLVKFEEGVVPGGMVFVNSDVVTDKVSRTDLTAYYIPCSQIADEVGNPKVWNPTTWKRWARRSAAAWPACSDLFQRAGEFAHRPSLFGGPCAFCAF